MNVLYKNKYIKYVLELGNEKLANQLVYMIKRDLIDDLQHYLNTKYGFGLVEDGILGIRTLEAIDTALRDDEYNIDAFIMAKAPKPENKKTILLNFLAEVEGTIIHFNAKTETSYTTPYGIYRKAFPHATICKYVDRLYEENGLNRNIPSHARKLNRLLTNEQKETIKELAWDFYKRNFIDERLIGILDSLTSLSYFSIAVNGGKGRGIKSIQSPIGTSVDGKLGPKTIKKLRAYLTSHTFKDLNMGMLEYMYFFYQRLIRRKPKFRIYRIGWYNRLLKTSCGLFQKKHRSL